MSRDLMATVRAGSIRPLRARHRSERGAALVELAVSLPLLILLLVGTADFARVFYFTIELTNAARAGAQYAAYSQVQAQQAPKITNAATSAAPNIAPIIIELHLSSGLPDPPVCYCALDDGTGQPWSGVACTSICGSGHHLVETVTVTASKTFSTISHFPGIPNTLNLSRAATLRVALQ
jgi:hypothetical protein